MSFATNRAEGEPNSCVSIVDLQANPNQAKHFRTFVARCDCSAPMRVASAASSRSDNSPCHDVKPTDQHEATQLLNEVEVFDHKRLPRID